METVLRTHKTARRAAGLRSDVTFDEYVEELTSVAQVLDQDSKTRTNPRAERSVNEHEFDDGYGDFEANVHDIDTPIDELMPEVHSTAARPTAARPPSQFGQRSRPGFNRQPTGNRKKIFLDRDTWQTLTDLDKKSWDTITDKGKEAIVEYGGKRAALNRSRSVNEHEAEQQYEFDDSPGAEGSVTNGEPGEVSNAEMFLKTETREISKADTSTEKTKSILKNDKHVRKSNVFSKKKNSGTDAEMTVNRLMSTHSNYVVRRQDKPDRNSGFREVSMSVGEFSPDKRADFEGEVSMAEIFDFKQYTQLDSSSGDEDSSESEDSEDRRERRRRKARRKEKKKSKKKKAKKKDQTDGGQLSDTDSTATRKAGSSQDTRSTRVERPLETDTIRTVRHRDVNTSQLSELSRPSSAESGKYPPNLMDTPDAAIEAV